MNWIVFLAFLPGILHAKTVTYKLETTQKSINASGKEEVSWAMVINGSLPGPTLTFTEGDIAEIVVVNRLTEDVSFHWHGLLVPPEMDGVPYLNTPPIKPGTSFTFRFPLKQSGTYWYHSHTMLQEQKGLYGAFIVKALKKEKEKDFVVLMGDWSDENPDFIMENLRKDGDYYLYKKATMRSLFGAFEADALGSYLKDQAMLMGGMDYSDVGYDAFLINGKRDSQLAAPKPGETIRLRLINAAASTYFQVNLAQQLMEVVATDGRAIKPRKVGELLMAMGETYDVLVSLPPAKNLELRATAQDLSGHTSAWIGEGEREYAPDKKPVDLYAPMQMQGMGQGMSHHHHMMAEMKGSKTLKFDDLADPNKTAFAPNLPRATKKC